jgi:large subunit ribosomal protein L9
MKVILVKDVQSLGTMGNVVKVKDGYARNYLIPRSLAIVASESNRKELEHKKREIDARKEKLVKETKELAHKIEKIKVTIHKQTGEEGKIFGSVTSSEIAAFFEAKGIDVSKKDIIFKEDIKKVGTYAAQINLHQEVVAQIKIKVEASPKEKE